MSYRILLEYISDADTAEEAATSFLDWVAELAARDVLDFIEEGEYDLGT